MPEQIIVPGNGALLFAYAPSEPTNVVALSAAAKDGNGGEQLPRGTMVAYTGGPLELGFGRPVYFDVDGMDIPAQSVTVLRQHDHNRVLGHTERVEKVAHALHAAWLVSGDGDYVDSFVKTSRRGVPWQTSVGIWARRWETVTADATASVNGRQINGPAYIVRGSMLGEISIVPWGADHKTSNSIAASAAEEPMRRLLASLCLDPNPQGGNPAGATATAPPAPAAPVTAATPAPVTPAAVPAAPEPADPARTINAGAAAAVRRINKLTEIAARYPNATRANPDMLAAAIEGDVTPEAFELQAMRADRPTSEPPIRTEATVCGRPLAVLEAAVARGGGMNNRERHFTAATLEAADKAFPRGIQLKRFVEILAEANGYRGRFDDDHDGCLRAAFSTSTASTAFTSVMNKSLLEGWSFVDPSWREIVKVIPLNNLQPHTRFRMHFAAVAERVTDGGELKHGNFGDRKHTIEGDTFGKMLAITRKMLINDDAGALTEVPSQLGRGQAIALVEAIYTAILANVHHDTGAFFHADHGNYVAGATTLLDTEGMRQAVQAFMDMKDPTGKPINGVPKLLLVPTALAHAGKTLFTSAEIRDTTASKLVMTGNIYQNGYKPIVSNYLGNSTFSGYSAKAWYLLADPQVMPIAEVGFLNGIQVPTIERVDVAPDQLGMAVRTYFDWGVAMANREGAVKMKGEA